TGVQTCALPISLGPRIADLIVRHKTSNSRQQFQGRAVHEKRCKLAKPELETVALSCTLFSCFGGSVPGAFLKYGLNRRFDGLFCGFRTGNHLLYCPAPCLRLIGGNIIVVKESLVLDFI